MKSEQFRKYWRKEIALYKGDDLIDQGTVQEIADRKGVLKSTIYWYCSNASQRRADSFKDQAKTTRVVVI